MPHSLHAAGESRKNPQSKKNKTQRGIESKQQPQSKHPCAPNSSLVTSVRGSRRWQWMFWGAGCHAPTVGLLLLGGLWVGCGAAGSSPGARNNKQQLCWWCLVPDQGHGDISVGRSWLAALCPRCSAGLQPFPEVCWGRGDTGVGFTPRGCLCKLILWQLACD